MLDELLVGGEIQESSKKNIIRAVTAQDVLQEVSCCGGFAPTSGGGRRGGSSSLHHRLHYLSALNKLFPYSAAFMQCICYL